MTSPHLLPRRFRPRDPGRRGTIRPLVLAAMALLAALLAAAALAQDGAASVRADGPAADAGGRSFAAAFFVSRRTTPEGEVRVEVLGSLVIWLLLLMSVASMGLIGSMALVHRRRSIVPEDLLGDVERLLDEGRHREAIERTRGDRSFLGRVMSAGLGQAPHGFGAMLRALEQTSDELTADLHRRVEVLNVVGQVSPMIGLFGTVYGMILAFQSIVVAGGNADPVLLAGGIGTALTTTFWGLVVAIPALAGYALVRTRIDALTAEATLSAESIVGRFRPRPASARNGSGKAAAKAPGGKG